MLIISNSTNSVSVILFMNIHNNLNLAVKYTYLTFGKPIFCLSLSLTCKKRHYDLILHCELNPSNSLKKTYRHIPNYKQLCVNHNKCSWLKASCIQMSINAIWILLFSAAITNLCLCLSFNTCNFRGGSPQIDFLSG